MERNFTSGLEQSKKVRLQNADDPFLGMFSDEPELVDQVMVSTMMARKTHPLRQSNG